MRILAFFSGPIAAVAGLALLAALPLSLAGSSCAADARSDYRVGDRLSPSKSATAPAAVYQETPWDALIPKDWDPQQAFKGLDLRTLKDSDPRAMEALQRLRESWAPGKLGQRPRRAIPARSAHPHRRLHGTAGKEGRRGLRVPSRPLFRRLHPISAPASTCRHRPPTRSSM